ncbi:hypothetical protein TNCV_3781301 [Trichonephila clavipes]|nr:hypothetical protein TNCV_3781301 [Trichonephila clavipes]
MDSTRETMAAATFDASDWSLFNGVINDELGRTNDKTPFFSDEPRFCLQHEDGRIRVWQYLVERTLVTCIRHCHTGQSPGVMIWVAILDTRLGHLLFALTALLSVHVTFLVFYHPWLYPLFKPCETLHFSRIMHTCMLPVIVWTLLDTENVWLLAGLHVHKIFHQ